MAKKAVLTVISEYDTKYGIAKVRSGDKTIDFRARKTAKFVNPPTGVRFVTVYIHGNAENAAGFDIPVYKKGTMELSATVQPCLLEVPSGQSMECSLFLWRPDIRQYVGNGTYVEQPDERLWGLIVSVKDEQSLKYAQTCQRRKNTP